MQLHNRETSQPSLKTQGYSRALGIGWALTLFLMAGTLEAAPVKYRYPLGTPSTWTTYRDNDGGGGIIDWNGGKLTYNSHEGTDFARPKGDPIYAAADGTVEEVIDGKFDDCRSGACASPSNRVRLKHADGQVTYYLHMKKFSIVVKVGQKVKCGQKIGEVASSGRSTGNHLHFQVGNFRASKEPFQGKKGASSSLWTSQGGYGRSGIVPGSACHNTTPECTKDADCKNASKPICSSNTCVPRPPATCPFVKTVRLNGLTLRMRAQSNTSSSVVGQVPEGVCLPVNKQAQGEDVSGNKTWYEVRYNGVTGWVSGAFADCSTCGGECANGASRSCYTGPPNTKDKGICKGGTQTCSGNKWGSCAGQQVPKTEACGNQIDDNCDGKVDEDCTKPPECTAGETRACETKLVAPCKEGTQACDNGKWAPCIGNTLPSTEICDGKDNNCDGLIDEGCPPPDKCIDEDKDGFGRGAQCTGPQDCDDTNKDINPSANEVCDNGKDDNCNGQIDENCEPVEGCEDKDKDGYRSGATCPPGTPLDCDDNHPLIHPGAQETCGNGVDEDCDGFDLTCMENGEIGCTHDGACQSRFCFKRNGESACSTPCPNNECPAGFTCVDNRGCWPNTPVTPEATPPDTHTPDAIEKDSGVIQIGCKTNNDCKAPQVCVNLQCTNDRKVPSGCNTIAPITPLFPILLMLGLLALFRRRSA